MIATISALENKVMKAIFGIAQKAKNVNFPKELLVEKEVLKNHS